MQSTLSIIKPDAIKKGFTEDICSRIENSGLNIVLKKLSSTNNTVVNILYPINNTLSVEIKKNSGSKICFLAIFSLHTGLPYSLLSIFVDFNKR